ncbi:MAG: hypothetical protein RL299_1549 [Pseudomonadota bacterium]|jgi:hypothetical protein
MRGLLLSGLAALVALSSPAAAQERAPVPAGGANPLCTFHGDGCEAPPAKWTWQRLEPKTGAYSVALPCDETQANAFGEVLAMSRASFPAGATRACMKATSGFTATLIGFTALPNGAKTPELEKLLKGAPDLFTAFTSRDTVKAIPVTTYKGRRAAINVIEKDGARTKVLIVEAGKFALVMLVADIRADFPGTREEGDVATEHFINSLEIAQ